MEAQKETVAVGKKSTTHQTDHVQNFISVI